MATVVDPLSTHTIVATRGGQDIRQYAFKNRDGTAHDLTPYVSGSGITSRLRDKNDGTILTTKTIGSGIVVDDAVNGLATVTYTASNTAGLTPSSERYDHDIFGDDGGAAGAKALLRLSRFVVKDSTA